MHGDCVHHLIPYNQFARAHVRTHTCARGSNKRETIGLAAKVPMVVLHFSDLVEIYSAVFLFCFLSPKKCHLGP